MDQLRDQVVGCKIFTKLDLRAGYNLIRIKEGDEWMLRGLYQKSRRDTASWRWVVNRPNWYHSLYQVHTSLGG